MKRIANFLILGAALAAIVLGASAPAVAESASSTEMQRNNGNNPTVMYGMLNW